MRELKLKSRDEVVGIGGTDAKRIVEGDWYSLYLEKTGQAPPKDLSNEWKPRLGLETEPLHAWWHCKQEGITECHLLPGAVLCPDIPWLFASLDRYLPVQDEPLEMKHTYAANSLRDAAETYMPQLQTQLIVTGCTRLRFSIIRGNEPPIWAHVDRDEGYIKRMLAMLEQFWWHVENLEPPEQPDVVDMVAATKAVKVAGKRAYDMTGNNAWAAYACDFQDDAEAAKRYEVAKDGLKKLVPDDACEAAGHGITIKRDARGALRFS